MFLRRTSTIILTAICLFGALSAAANPLPSPLVQTAKDLNAGCLDKDFIQKMNTQFDISLQQEVPTDLCDVKNTTLKFYKSLRVLSDVQFSQKPFNNRYNRNLLAKGFFPFLTDRIKKITEVDAQTLNCQNGAMAFVDISQPENGMFLCPSFFDPAYSIYYAASVILHEAHHVEGHEHSLCLLGSKIGNTGGCDESIEDDGAYAVSTEALARMALLAVNISDADKRDLKLALLDSLDSFNESIHGLRNKAVYLVSQDQKQAFFYDGSRLYPAPLFKEADLLSRDVSLIKVPHNNNQAVGLDSLTENLEPHPVEGMCALDYNKTVESKRSRLVDIINDLNTSVCVFENRIVGTVSGLTSDEEDHVIDLPFKVKYAYAGDEIRPDALDSVFVVSTDNKFYRIVFKTDGKVDIALETDQRNGFQKLFYFASDLSGLNEDGRFMTLDFETEKWISPPGLEDKRFHSVSRPFLWSYDLIPKGQP